MAHPILMPKPGQMTEACVVVAWHKSEGDVVHKGDVIFEIETDKSVMDVESFEEGVLLKRYVEVGQSVPVNSVCAYVGAPGEIVPEEVAVVAAAAPSASIAAPPTALAEPADGEPRTAPAPIGDEGRRLAISPRASRLAATAGIDIRTLVGSGSGGRITERDVRAVIDMIEAAPATPAATASPAAPATPAEPTIAPVATNVAAGQATDDDDEGPRPMSRMRRVIAERLSWSASTIPHFSLTISVDMTRILALRAELKAAGTSLSVTDFILAAAAQTVVEFPEVNSRTDGTSVWLRRRVHLGLAVSVPNGLVVPVLRDADKASLQELHDRTATLAGAARNGTLALDDMTGSTFTVSNLGMFGVDEFKAIINPGEAAILAVSSVIPTPVAVGDGIGIRQIMKLTLSADHRLVDGELAARFMNALRRRLQDAEAFRREDLNA